MKNHEVPMQQFRCAPLLRSARLWWLALAALVLVLFLFVTLTTSHAASPVIWYVAPTGDDGHDCLTAATACKTVGGAVAKATGGDAIMVATGAYTEHLALDKSLTISGAGANATILDGARSGTVISITSTLSSTTVVTITGVAIRGGTPSGIVNHGTLNLQASDVSGNSGGILNSSTITMSDVVVSGNTSGGIANFRGAFLERVTISNNAGSGIYNTGAMTLTNVTISNNQFRGIENQGSPPPQPPSPPRPPATVRLVHVTISGNQHGVFNLLGSVTLGATILANNTGGNCQSAIASNGNNLSSDTSCATYLSAPGDRNSIDPRLGPLQDNGGLTPTQALLPGSPAIDHGTLSVCASPTDARGVPRPIDGDHDGAARCDSGAYEYNPRLLFLPAVRK